MTHKTLKTSAANFIDDESGAVTVDWVVLTATIVGLGIAVTGVVSGGMADLSGDIDTQLSGQLIETAFVSAWSYAPQNQEKWEDRMAGMRDNYSGKPADDILERMNEQLADIDTVRDGQQDEYAAYQIVLEENGGSVPDEWPDMRDF
jgi:Flp pilus assembly pilin Flp